MAVDRILIDAGPGETRVAFLEGERLRELWVDRDGAGSLVGNIYLGRVEHVAAGIAAAFVDIGRERSGFLGLADTRPAQPSGETPKDRISDYLSEGDAVLVQVQRDPAADKGAKLTTRLSLTGRFAVLLPDSEEVHLSRRVDGKAERERLQEFIRQIRQPGEGIILRTVAAGAETAELEQDIERLRRQRSAIEARVAAVRAPALIQAEPGAARRALRDETGADVREIMVAADRLLGELRRECEERTPGLAARLVAHDGPAALFEDYGVEEGIDRALARQVDLPSGGSIIIDETAALVAIDVNTGGKAGGGPDEAASRANLEAVAEIAVQLRLRNLSGQFAVDFVPLKKRRNQAEVVEALRAAVADDRCPTHVFGFTRLGLVEMTRQRRSPSLREVLCSPCPACDGTASLRSPLTLALESLRRALRADRAAPGAGVEVVAPPAVVEALEGAAAQALAATRERLGGRLVVRAEPGQAPDRIEIIGNSGSGTRA